MIGYCLLILAVLAGTQAEQSEPCSKQLELEHRCMFSVEGSPEADLIRDRKKQIMQTCAPNLPSECHTQCQAMHDCAMSIAKNMDTDPGFAESKPKSQQGVDQCFVQHPPDVHKGMEEIFMQDWMKPPHHRGPWGMHDNSTFSEDKENGTMGWDRRHGRHGRHGRKCRPHHHRHHWPINDTSSSSESKSNETSAESGGKSSGGKSGGKAGGKSGGKSGEKFGGKSRGKSWEKHIPPQCRPSAQQKDCIKNEFKKLVNDTAFVSVMNNLIRQKKKCKLIADWSCTPKCPKQQKCIFEATTPCRTVFMQRMKTCMEGKGFTLPPFMDKGDFDASMLTTPLSVIKH